MSCPVWVLGNELRSSQLRAQHPNTPARCRTDPVPACAQAAPLETGLTPLMEGPGHSVLSDHSNGQGLSLKQTSPVRPQPV